MNHSRHFSPAFLTVKPRRPSTPRPADRVTDGREQFQIRWMRHMEKAGHAVTLEGSHKPLANG